MVASPRPSRVWMLAIALYGVGDLSTTLLGVTFEHVVETGPVAEPFLQRFGPAAIVALKPIVFVVAYALWRIAPKPHRVGVPLGLAVVGAVTTVWNCLVIAGVT